MKFTNTLLPLSTLLLAQKIQAIDFVSSYNLNNTRWDATLTDSTNNVNCTRTYTDTTSLLLPDSAGYLSSGVAIALECTDVNYKSTTTVSETNSTVSYTVPGGDALVFTTTLNVVLGDSEVFQAAYGVESD